MKKISLLVLSAFIFFLNGNLFAQVIDEDEETSNWDSFYERSNNNRAKKPFAYPYVRAADVVWQQRVWRTVDFREKMNQPFYFPRPSDDNPGEGAGLQGRANLFTVLDRALKDGTIKCYADDEFKVEISYDSVMSWFRKSHLERKFIDNIDDPDGEQIETDVEVFEEFKEDEVQSMRIKEDWYVDKQRSVRDVRIIGFCLVGKVQEGQGDAAEMKNRPMGWIRYNDPAVRNLLANSEMYNPRNDVQQISYDDVFVKRLFSSYVTRTSNTYNRQISGYLSGLDALLESDLIEEEIFNREQDMWEY